MSRQIQIPPLTSENCYTELISYSGSITSLDYPQPYPGGRNCIWVISTRSDYKLQLVFETLDVENHTWCKYDHVTVYDGLSIQDKVMGQFCGQQVPLPLITSKNDMRIVFVSDPRVEGSGFKASYTSVVCGANFNQSKGSFDSPHFRGNYTGNRKCIWTIETDKHSQVSLSINYLHVSESSSCPSEYLEIYSLSNVNSPSSSEFSYLSPSRSLLLARICGNHSTLQILNDIRSTSNKMYVSFVSESLTQGFTFQASYTSVSCGDYYEKDEGNFASVNYPANYPNDVDCVWTIKVPNGYHVALKLPTFQISSTPNCTGDYIEIRGGLNDSSPLLLDPFCGTSAPHLVLSPSNEMRVRFKSDSEENSVGFFANFTAVPCGGHYEKDDGTFKSVNYPFNYPDNMDCVWTVTVSEDYRVALQFITFQVTHTSNCTGDYMEIRDGLNDSSPQLLHPLCGTSVPHLILSPSNEMWIRFKSDSEENKVGFFANFTAVTCGGHFEKDEGTFESVNYPFNYPDNMDCAWTITVSEGYHVALQFNSFQVAHTPNCIGDYMEIRDGLNDSSSLLIDPLCGSSAPHFILSPSNKIWIRFKSDSKGNDVGFLAKFTAVSCGGHYEEDGGTFASVNYPLNYPNNMNCAWTIEVSEGYQVALQFNAFQISHTPNCTGDYVEIRNGLNDSSPLILYPICGSSAPHLILSPSNQMRVRFNTDSEENSVGFFANFTAVSCGGHYAEDDGTFKSVNYPSNYPDNMDCVWTIAVSEGYQIVLKFTDFQVSATPNCTGDYVEIRDGLNDSSPLLLDYLCGTSPPNSIRSSSNEMRVRFRSDAEENDVGIFATFTTDIDECATDNGGCQHVCKNTIGSYVCSCHTGSILQGNLHGCDIVCGGDFEADGGELEIFTNRTTTTEYVDCIWTITVSEGYQVALRFMAIQGSYNSDCRREYAGIKDGLNDTSPMIMQSVCNWSPRLHLSASNTVQLRYNIYTGYSHNKLFAEFAKDINECATNNGGCQYTCTNSAGSYICSCPEGMSLTEGKHYCRRDCYYRIRFRRRDGTSTISSPNYPNTYPNNKMCTWILETKDVGDMVQFVFTDIRTERSLDSISVFDGNSDTALGVFSGNMKPTEPIYSSNNSLKVVFKSDESVTAKGFRAQYASVCGGRFNAVPAVQHLYSHPGYGSERYKTWMSCDWIIQSKNERPVAIGFDDFDTETCAWTYDDYLDVYEYKSYSLDLTSRGRYCDTQLKGRTFSSNRGFLLRFRTDGDSKRYRGFHAWYYTT